MIKGKRKTSKPSTSSQKFTDMEVFSACLAIILYRPRFTSGVEWWRMKTITSDDSLRKCFHDERRVWNLTGTQWRVKSVNTHIHTRDRRLKDAFRITKYMLWSGLPTKQAAFVPRVSIAFPFIAVGNNFFRIAWEEKQKRKIRGKRKQNNTTRVQSLR